MKEGGYQNTRVLITVTTYPHPSRGYKELVCTAAVTEAGEWIRLYPIYHRYLPPEMQFHKYQWIEVRLAPRGISNDNRKESRRPDLESIRLLGEPLSTKDGWRERRQIIDKLPHCTVNQLKALYEEDLTSLGVVRPSRVLDLKIEKAERTWKPKWQGWAQQLNLFGPPTKPLTKIPFKFSYVFECEDSDKPHNAMIEDWELGMLYLNEMERLGSEKRATASVRSKFLDQMCAADRDTRFFMGTTHPFNTWIVLGVFWPPKVRQMELIGNATTPS